MSCVAVLQEQEQISVLDELIVPTLNLWISFHWDMLVVNYEVSTFHLFIYVSVF